MSDATETLERYRWTRPFPTRWHDIDVFGHVNNTIYYASGRSGGGDFSPPRGQLAEGRLGARSTRSHALPPETARRSDHGLALRPILAGRLPAPHQSARLTLTRHAHAYPGAGSAPGELSARRPETASASRAHSHIERELALPEPEKDLT
ncbi:thioesterase [Amnibacterium sp. CER49]|uniref:acyl-ACP thioesterase domain-containing protein n=1 Tax=Amnibacterium sp. CER49 TaxID=3039161 RepID=UPI00244B4D4C|nr:acyl-ACP thioesterase domain-containing protein [Amnibacterium sp. CER49]MDH2444928.1 thioesterase [Amnibacterium sp. CER49]